MSDGKVRWGIISTANISDVAFIPAFRQAARGELVAVASRERATGEEFASRHEIPQVFDSYRAMLESDAIDAVYNPLPNSLHAEWTIAAAQNGKHVFCEKPLGVDAGEVERMATACADAGVLLFEAFVFKCHPQSHKLRKLVADGAIGELVQMQAHFNFYLKRPTDNIRLNKGLAGGALMDVGCYPITFARYIYGREPMAVTAECRIDPDYDVETHTSMVLDFGGDAHAALIAGFDAAGGCSAKILGSQGYIEVPSPYHPAEQSSFVLHKGGEGEVFSFDTGTRPFAPAIEHFNDCLLGGAELMDDAGGAAMTMQVIAGALESARTGRRVEL